MALKGKVNPEFTYLTSALLDESTLELEVNFSIAEDSLPSAGRSKPLRSTALSARCSLNIIIYGPIDLFEDIGSFFQDYEMYLQDPVGCKRNVRYCNPHRLPLLDPTATKFTFGLAKPLPQVIEMEDIGTRPELLEILDSQEDLPETSQPPSIRTTLAMQVSNERYIYKM